MSIRDEMMQLGIIKLKAAGMVPSDVWTSDYFDTVKHIRDERNKEKTRMENIGKSYH